MKVEYEGTLDGAITGWNGNTVFRFTTGFRWKQAVYRYQYFYLYRPEARIWANGSEYLLEIDGVDEMLPVMRVH